MIAATIRIATPEDARSILEIYAPYITHTSLTFETEVPSEQAFAERMRNYLQTWPWLVCEVDGNIAGYSYATRYRERTGYQWCTESSIYIKDEFKGTGMAKALYSALFEILKRQGFRNVYAVINLPNDRSVVFHESCGFSWFATYENVGYKLGQWKNVGWWRLQINDYSDEPDPPIAFKKMDKSSLKEIFDKAEKLIQKKK